jgi:subtilisin family serine protease
MSTTSLRALLHAAAAALLIAAAPAQGAPATPGASATPKSVQADIKMETSTATGRNALLAEASRKGTIPVVVSLKLDTPWVPEERLKARLATGAWRLDAVPKSKMAAGVADMSGFDPITTQRANVAAAQAEVLGAIPKSGGRAIHRYNVPAISLTVTRAELDKLLANPKVAHVAIEKEMKPHLSETTHTIAAAAADLAGFSGAGWTVAVIDSGVNNAHPFLQGKVIDEACFSTSETGRTTLCPSGTSPQIGAGAGINCDVNILGCPHGTHVAGIAAGRNGCGNGSCGFDGVARDATIMAVQVFRLDPSTGEIRANMADVRSALEYVYAARSRLQIASVNLSLGSGLYDGACDASDPATTQAMDNLRAANIAVVVSTGNDNVSNAVSMPACLSPAIAVSGSSGDKVWAPNGDYGANNSVRTDLLAPAARATGQGVLSSYLAYQTGEYRYDYINGTSMASPHVAGAFAVLRQANAVSSVATLQATLEATGTMIADARTGVQRPRINLAAALAAVRTADQDGDGLPDTLESVEGRNMTVKDNDVLGVARLFAMQQYRDFYAREGSADEVASLANSITGGSVTRARAATDFLGSDEYALAGFVTRLYFASFLRLPDYPGQMGWMAELRDGATLSSVTNGFAWSPEFLQRYGNLDNAGFVTQMYRNVLGREPEAAGASYWTQKLDSGELTRGDVLYGFSESTEFKGNTANDVFVTDAYVAMLKRVPSQSDLNAWMMSMDQGTSGADVVGVMLGWGEYRSRFMP